MSNVPQVCFVNGTAVAETGEHVFKDAVANYGSDIRTLCEVANVTMCPVDENGLYILREEGYGVDYGEKYLIVSKGVVANGGEIKSINSPIRAYNNYNKGISGVKQLMNMRMESSLQNSLMRMLYINVCCEMEGYLVSLIPSLIQGVRDIFIMLREEAFFKSCRVDNDEHRWRENLANHASVNLMPQRITSRKSGEREIFEKLLGQKLCIRQELLEAIEWRNKLTHRVLYQKRSIYPNKNDVIDFINEADNLVNFIDSHIKGYKCAWLDDSFVTWM